MTLMIEKLKKNCAMDDLDFHNLRTVSVCTNGLIQTTDVLFVCFKVFCCALARTGCVASVLNIRYLY